MDYCILKVGGKEIQVVCEDGIQPLSIEPAVVDKRTTLNGQILLDMYGRSMSYSVIGIVSLSDYYVLVNNFSASIQAVDPYITVEGRVKRLSTSNGTKDLTYRTVNVEVEIEVTKLK